MKRKIFIVLTCIAIYATSLSMGPSGKQQDQTIIESFITELKKAQANFDEKAAQAVKENAQNIIPALENLSDEEKAIALSEIEAIMAFFKPVAKRTQQERKKEVSDVARQGKIDQQKGSIVYHLSKIRQIAPLGLDEETIGSADRAIDEITTLDMISPKERENAIAEINRIVAPIRARQPKKSQPEQKMEAGAMPAAPGGPGSQPKKVIQQKPMSEARKRARDYAKQNRDFYQMTEGTDTSLIRSELSEKERADLDQDLYTALSAGLGAGRVGSPFLGITNTLIKGASPNAYIVSRSKKISVPAFWGLINASQEGRYAANGDNMHNVLIYLHRYGADFDLKASDGTPILNYLIKYWPNLEKPNFAALQLLPRLISGLMLFGVNINAIDANGDTFLDILLKRIDDPFITGKGKEILDIIIGDIAIDTQKQELRDMIAEYKKEHVQPLREQMRQPAQQEVIQQPGIRNIVEGYLFGEKE